MEEERVTKIKEKEAGQEKKPESEIEEVKKKLAECEKLKKDYLAGWQRSRADFLNYKKEEGERFQIAVQYGKEEVILEILLILDNLEKAERELPEDLKNNDYVQGLIQIKQQIEDFLKKHKIERIETLGKKFDPNFHEAVEEIEVKDKGTGTIIEEVQPGYLYKDKLLRPARVKVAR